jgi:NitT/TauT family transport system substrate-binding protein
MKRIMMNILVFALIIGIMGTSVWAKPSFKVAWSIYAGWMPWDYAGSSGILKKWADTYGIEINLIRMDYLPSVEAYVAQQVDAWICRLHRVLTVRY